MKNRTIRAANRAAMKARRGQEGSGRSRYGQRMRAARAGTVSVTSPFYSAALHTGVAPTGPRETWSNQRPLLSQERLTELWEAARS